MSLLRDLRFLFRRRKIDAELDEEIQAHLAIDRRQRIEAGDSPEQADAAACKDFGNILLVKEVTREMWGWSWLEQFVQDVRHGCRILGRNPAFALVAILSLGLGIGTATAVFGVFDAALLRPMAGLPEPERLVLLIPQFKGQRSMLVNPIFEGLRDRQQSLEGVFAVNDAPFLKVQFEGAAPSYLRGSIVSGAYFRTLGLTPAAGRFIDENDDQLPGAQAGHECAAVISHGLWTEQFNKDPELIGRKLRVKDIACTVVGVAPPGFRSHQPGYHIDVWVPMHQIISPGDLANHYGAFFSGVMGRLKPGVSARQAQAELTAFYQELQAAEPIPPPNITDKPIPPADVSFTLASGGHGLDAVQREFGRPLQLLLILVGIVLLIASANVAGLVLGRGMSRASEFATRAAIGAGQGRIARQLLAEGGVLAGLGGIVGVALAYFTGRALASLISLSWMPISLEVKPDLRLLAAACIATGCATLLCSLLPAWRIGKQALGGVLGGAGRATAGSASGRFGRALVVVQLALSLTLVAAVGLLLRTVVKLSDVHPGFRPDHVVVLQVGHEAPRRPSSALAPSADQKTALASVYRRVEDQLRAIPGARQVSLSWLGLFRGGDQWIRLFDPASPETKRSARIDYVSAGYFDTVGMPCKRGRSFADADRQGALRVAVINESMVREQFGNTDPIGQRLELEYPGEEKRPFTIVGVVGDSKYNNLREDAAMPMIWVPLAQAPLRIRAVMLQVTPGAEQAVVRQAGAAMTAVDPNIMVREVTTLKAIVDRTTARERMLLGVAAAFGGLSLLLAAIGVYGALSFAVTTRTREIGVRLALGASPAKVLRSIVMGAMRLALWALALGLPAALAVGYTLRSFLYGVEAHDSRILLISCAVLAITAILAAYVPARRAAKIEPVTALRHE